MSHEPSRGQRLLRALRISLVGSAALALLLLVAGLAFGAYQLSQAKVSLRDVPQLTDPSQVPLPQPVAYYSADGVLLGSAKAENRIVLGPRDIPPIMRQATVAIEDQRFYQHHGVDFVALGRAALADLRAGHAAQGASTLTMQYVRNVYLNFQKTANRKLQEIALSVQLESIWNKDRILTAYLNTVCYGEGAYGVEAAARKYFGVSARQLQLPQAALLAGMVQGPARLSPRRFPERALARRNLVLDEMYAQGMITLPQALRAKRAPLGLRALRASEITREPGLVNLLSREFRRYLPGRQTVGGVRVISSFRMRDIRRARRILAGAYANVSGEKPVLAAAFVQATNGRILLLAHSDPRSTYFDYSWQAQRQPGSTVKAFTAATLLAGGGQLSDGVNNAPLRVADGRHNYWVQPTQGGVQNVYDALRFSQNPASWRLYQRAGPQNVLALEQRFGLSGMDANSAAALGGVRVGTSPLSLAGAFDVFASDGRRAPVHAMVRVVDTIGNTIWSDRVLRPKQLYPTEYARQMNVGLQRVVNEGFTRLRDNLPLAGRRPLAGKTGTSEKNADAWFAGYTPQLAGAVWTGFARSRRSMTGLPGGDVWGSTVPASYWDRIAAGLLQNQPVRRFARPQGLQRVPDLHGLTRNEAAARLGRWRFANARWSSRFDKNAKPGQVLRQDPAPGTWIGRDAPVSVIYATDRLPTPSVVGQNFLTAQDAVGRFAKLQLRFQVSSRPLGEILAQDPVPGFSLSYGGTLNVVVATQAGPIRRVVKRVPYVPSDSELQLLRNQLAAANARANQPTPSRLVLPAVIGLEPSQAQMVLSSMGVTVSIRGTGLRVSAQSPSPGSTLRDGQTVTLQTGN